MKTSITSSEGLLLKLEEQMGMKNSLTVNYKMLAKKLGLGSWSKSLTEKLEKLQHENRIEIIRHGIKSNFDLNLIRPLTAEEKSNLRLLKSKKKGSSKKQVITREEEQIINSLPQGKLSDEARKQMLLDKVAAVRASSNSDIDKIFDDLTNISRNVISKLSELKEENEQLKFLLENAKEREKIWMARATMYRQQLLSN